MLGKHGTLLTLHERLAADLDQILLRIVSHSVQYLERHCLDYSRRATVQFRVRTMSKKLTTAN